MGPLEARATTWSRWRIGASHRGCGTGGRAARSGRPGRRGRSRSWTPLRPGRPCRVRRTTGAARPRPRRPGPRRSRTAAGRPGRVRSRGHRPAPRSLQQAVDVDDHVDPDRHHRWSRAGRLGAGDALHLRVGHDLAPAAAVTHSDEPVGLGPQGGVDRDPLLHRQVTGQPGHRDRGGSDRHRAVAPGLASPGDRRLGRSSA